MFCVFVTTRCFKNRSQLHHIVLESVWLGSLVSVDIMIYFLVLATKSWVCPARHYCSNLVKIKTIKTLEIDTIRFHLQQILIFRVDDVVIGSNLFIVIDWGRTCDTSYHLKYRLLLFHRFLRLTHDWNTKPPCRQRSQLFFYRESLQLIRGLWRKYDFHYHLKACDK